MEEASSLKILFYDAECGVCTRAVRWAMTLDPDLSVASLQGETARKFLPPEFVGRDLSTVALWTGRRLLVRTDVIEFLLREKASRGSTRARWAGKLLAGCPKVVRDSAYGYFARHRQNLLFHFIFAAGENCDLTLDSRTKNSRFLP